MRVITGSARGVKLQSLDGLATRPTTDMVKESIFNIIQFEIEGRRVLDLFAGTGQLAIEALSRGADSAVLVDMSDEAIKVVKSNLKKAKLEERARVVKGEALSYLSACREKFGVIFLDPPYDSGLLEKAVSAIKEIDILTSSGIIVCEGLSPDKAQQVAGAEYSYRCYRYGKINVCVLRPAQE